MWMVGVMMLVGGALIVLRLWVGDEDAAERRSRRARDVGTGRVAARPAHETRLPHPATGTRTCDWAPSAALAAARCARRRSRRTVAW